MGGVWPVMLTPYDASNHIDYGALKAIIEWYEENGAQGLFAVCQSSEIFSLSLNERVELAAFVKNNAHIPVIASGHISEDLKDQLEELEKIGNTGVDAVVLITNRLDPMWEGQKVWLDNLNHLLKKLPSSLSLGLYECPHPYKRLISNDELIFCRDTGRFRFFKDTCCDMSMIKKRLEILEKSSLCLYNANTATLLDSLKAGAAGFSGAMANFHPDLYVKLINNWQTKPDEALMLQSALTVCSFIERQVYPINAKYHLRNLGLPVNINSRIKSLLDWSSLCESEVRQMAQMVELFRSKLGV